MAKERAVLWNLGEGIARAILHSSPRGESDPSDVLCVEHDTRGYIDGGPPCDECGACECEPEGDEDPHEGGECVGLSHGWSFVEASGDFLCDECFAAEYEVREAPPA